MEIFSRKNVIQKSWFAKKFPSPKLGARSPPLAVNLSACANLAACALLNSSFSCQIRVARVGKGHVKYREARHVAGSVRKYAKSLPQRKHFLHALHGASAAEAQRPYHRRSRSFVKLV